MDVVTLFDGVKVILGPKGMQKKNWRNGRYYEQKMLNHIKHSYQGGTFIDAGSCLGNHTLWFVRHCKSQVVSIEPVYESFVLQQQMLKMNGFSDSVTMLNVAVSDYDGRGSMKRFGDSIGHCKLDDGDVIDVMTIDTIVDELKLENVKVLKLDVEWSELNALKGAVKLLESQHPVVFAELNEQQYVNRATAFLAQFGYSRVGKFPAQNYEFK